MRGDKGKKIGKCECGGTVRGVYDFGRLFSWCEKCSPVVNLRRELAQRAAHRRIFRDARAGKLQNL